MRLRGEDRDLLIQKKVRLVQSGHFKDNIDSLNSDDIDGINDIVLLDYMGSSEFEWGSLPRSLRRMTISKDFYKVFIFDQYKDENGNPLKVYAPHVFFENVQSIVDKLVVNSYGLQEYCSLHKHIEKKENCGNDPFFDFKDDKNFWWDIENDFFMFFEHSDKVLMAMEALKRRKFGYDGNISKSALNKLDLGLLTKPNILKYMNCNTTLKDYYYDENTQIHFIEFRENSSLENILMEAMIIAKVDKGTVIFTINGICFSIDEDTELDAIIKEFGINLKDKCTCSDKINQLIASYNYEIEKKEKQRQLVYVLNLVRNKKLQ